ncbi:MAG: bifunctional adenosylcobinamide kinase/adenosylcobinamide-phosphate guanylyltransferase [Eubacteriales bacterium]|nr:bifunctional adenosylcobinamide kinase/adenosylcobinamide-phosphate guanylyltransferase [Eubacteriales bacterium]
MRILISGGCKNGKSSIAENWIAQAHALDPKQPLYYLATMIPRDDEDTLRIKRHQIQRSHLPFQTIEIERDIFNQISLCNPHGFFLLDSTTALLQNELFHWQDPFEVDTQAGQRVAADLCQLATRLDNLMIVSDYIYSDAFFYDPVTELFREELAQVDRAIATCCDVVVEICAGRAIVHKGQDLLSLMDYHVLNAV